jgi:uncharacterized membrane protein YoaK (UPF0700 family)
MVGKATPMAGKNLLSIILSITAGYVDTAGFLALHGLFTAHVTGNFVTLGAALLSGATGIIAKLLALPVFCLFVISARLLRYRLVERNAPVVLTLLVIKLALLLIAMVLAIRYGPFPRQDAWSATITGMLLVGAMAIQNALHRVHLASAPPSTLMTGTTTQIMLDLADLVHGVPAEQKPAIHVRMGRMASAVAAFAIGCAAGALLYGIASMWCFAIPPILILGALWRRGDADAP